ncbi:MAG: hypothetical protein U0797_27945 [Gemmataceae bacterium]
MTEPAQLPQSPLQCRQIVQMALDLAAQLEHEAQQAPPGSVLDACEGLRSTAGGSSSATPSPPPSRVRSIRPKKGGPGPHLHLRAGLPQQGGRLPRAPHRARRNPPERTYFHCPQCRPSTMPMTGSAATGACRSAERMITLAGVSRSFRHGETLLEQLAGWTTCHEVVRQVCYRQAGRLADYARAPRRKSSRSGMPPARRSSRPTPPRSTPPAASAT